MKSETCLKKDQLTVGDLIVAVTEAALETTHDEGQAYEIAGRVLTKLLVSAPESADYAGAAGDRSSIH